MNRLLLLVRKTLILLIAALSVTIYTSKSASGTDTKITQVKTHQDNKLITIEEQYLIIERVSTILLEKYVFPDIAKQMVTSLEHQIEQGKYSETVTPQNFAEQLTGNLYEIGKDRHLWVAFSPGQYPEPAEEPEQEEKNNQRKHLKRINFGFQQAKILPGNIGYLKINSFRTPELGGETAVAAMNFLSNSEALIFDLRQSGGGSADMVVFLISYLFGDEPVHLFDLYHRVHDKTDQYWTYRYLPGERLTDQPVFILTSSSTFSAPEGFAYTLQHLSRATIVGEQTGGGAHPGSIHRLSEDFIMFVASTRVINPVTGTNWEGTGVSPDKKVGLDIALEIAQKHALNLLLTETDDPERSKELRQIISEIKRQIGEAN